MAAISYYRFIKLKVYFVTTTYLSTVSYVQINIEKRFSAGSKI